MGFSELLEHLDERELDYVVERAKVNQDKDGYENAGISKSAFYKWDEEKRTHLNDLALKLKRESAVRAMLVFQDYGEEAAQNIVKLAEKARSESVRLKANEDIIERVAGKVSQKVEQENSGESKLIIEYVNDWRETGDED